MPLTTEFSALLNGMIAEKSPDAYVIEDMNHYTTASGLRSRYQAFFRRLNKTKEKVMMQSPHCIRHTYSTSLQRAGVPIAIVSVILGHSSTEMTDKYTHLDNIDDLRVAVDKAKKSTI